MTKVTRLRTALACHSLAWFLVLGVVESAFVAAVSSVRQAEALVGATAGLSALLCCWANSDRETLRARDLLARLGIVAAVTVATIFFYALQIKLDLNSLAGPGLSLLQVIRHMSDKTVWLNAIVAGVVLSGVVSSSSVVRRLARAMVEWRMPRPKLLLTLALAAPATLAIVAVIAERLVPVTGHASLGGRSPVISHVVWFLWSLLVSIPSIFAWYGFAAQRLTRRVSPLLAGLAIGVALYLPHQLAPLIIRPDIHFLQGFGTSNVLFLAHLVAVSVSVLWLAQRARGSLLPAVLFVTSVEAAGSAAFVWGASTVEATSRVSDIYAWLVIGLALLLALTGRMWRRSRTDDVPARAEGPRVTSIATMEVTVRDLEMPL